jgi:3-oxoacyl-[acyl-carrier protein] reductase
MTHIAPGSVVLVTGATGAIGLEIAAQAAAAGAVVAVHGSRDGTVSEAIAKIRARTPEAQLIAASADLADFDAIESMIAHVIAEGGRLDALVHCAITGAPDTSGSFANTNPRNFGAMAQRVLGVFEQLCWAALPHLEKQGGTIIGFASDAGRFAAPRQSVIGAAFGGIVAFVRNLSVEIARNGVRIHCITPSYVKDTPIYDRIKAGSGRTETASARAGLGLPSPRDIAPMVLFLCGPDAAKITGQVISINGGLNA